MSLARRQLLHEHAFGVRLALELCRDVLERRADLLRGHVVAVQAAAALRERFLRARGTGEGHARGDDRGDHDSSHWYLLKGMPRTPPGDATGWRGTARF